LSFEARVTQGVQELAHRLELQAGFAPQPRTGPYGHLAPEAAHGRQAATSRIPGSRPREVIGFSCSSGSPPHLLQTPHQGDNGG
jgi:hypothetical protein